MINIIIYEDNEDMQNLYREVIQLFFQQRNHKIKFHIFNHYTRGIETQFSKIPGKKIFILDIEVPGKSGLDLARAIRSNGDWMSPLIVITSYEYLKSTGFTSKVLMLDFISKRENVERRLKECLKVAYNIIHISDSYTFQSNGEIFRVQYNDILYFEKDPNDNYTFLYAKDASYRIKETLLQIENHLEDNSQFFRTHRSCIINIDNVSHLDYRNSIIYFGEQFTSLLTRDNKDILKKILNCNQIIR